MSRPHLCAGCNLLAFFPVAVEEENELDPSTANLNNFDKLSELQLHLIRHRELFLSRQIETYKIDMVRSVTVYRRPLYCSECILCGIQKGMGLHRIYR